MSQRRLFETPLSHSRSRNENDATNIVPLEHPTLILVSLDAFCFGLRDAFRAFFLTSFHKSMLLFLKLVAGIIFVNFFFCKTSHHRHTKNKNAKRNEINDDDDNDDDEIGSGIIRI